MSDSLQTDPESTRELASQVEALPIEQRLLIPLTNFSLSSVCPACDTQTFRLACKVRCPRCGFVWDCSEL